MSHVSRKFGAIIERRLLIVNRTLIYTTSFFLPSAGQYQDTTGNRNAYVEQFIICYVFAQVELLLGTAATPLDALLK